MSEEAELLDRIETQLMDLIEKSNELIEQGNGLREWLYDSDISANLEWSYQLLQEIKTNSDKTEKFFKYSAPTNQHLEVVIARLDKIQSTLWRQLGSSARFSNLLLGGNMILLLVIAFKIW